jgi:hypothetical protein
MKDQDEKLRAEIKAWNDRQKNLPKMVWDNPAHAIAQEARYAQPPLNIPQSELKAE